MGEDGEQIGIKSTDDAREYAYSKGLDLVEVAAGADPPVARVMDYGKYRYEQEQKAKLARKHQTQINVKEIKFRPKIGIHDYETKKGFTVTGTGKILLRRRRRTTPPGQMIKTRPGKRKRAQQDSLVASRDQPRVKKLLGLK